MGIEAHKLMTGVIRCDCASLAAAAAIARYVSGDFRFRNGYCRSNPRKMVQVWAEKEMRNLMRLRQVSLGR